MANFYVQPFQDTKKKSNLFSGSGTAPTNTLGSFNAPSFTVPSTFTPGGLSVNNYTKYNTGILTGGQATVNKPNTFDSNVPVITPTVNNNQVVKKSNPIVSNPITSTNYGTRTYGNNIYNLNAEGNPVGAPMPITSPSPSPAPEGSVSSIITPDTGYNYVGQDGNIYNSVTGLVENQKGEVEISPEQSMKDNLALYQAQIDAINNMYNDQLNQSRITNAPGYQARQDQNRLQQIQGGIASSPMGSAQTEGVRSANEQEQALNEAAINTQRANAINSIMGDVRKSSMADIEEKRKAKAKSADEYVKYLNAAPERKATQLSSAVKKAIALGLKPEDLSPEDLKALGGKEEFTSAYNEVKLKSDQEKRKTEAEILKLEGKDKQTALDNALKQKQIDVSWYNAETSRMNAENKTEEESLTESALSQKIYKIMADPSWNTPKEGQSNKQLKEAQKQYIMLLGGNPEDYGY